MPPRTATPAAQKKKQIAELATRLEKAAEAYYNSDTLLMTDAEYDAVQEQLRTLDPKHPLLLKVGAEEGGAAPLPYRMASLNKVHPDSQGGGGAVTRWTRKQVERGATRFLVTEKLDGLSCLWVNRDPINPKTGSMYLRGNGVKGLEIRGLEFARRVLGAAVNTMVPCVIRGELLLSEANTPAGSIGRSLVNGWIHRAMRGERFSELNLIQFVAYQVIEPSGLTREEQMQWLKENGYALPRFTVVGAASCKDGFLEAVLKGWKSGGGVYPIDGIVVAPANLPSEMLAANEDLRNPSDAVAFKMVLEEQIRQTRVVDVIWSASAQGYWIPRIQIEPVEISGARIQFCTGHNARTVLNGGIGMGAQIQIRRSGDVIPTLDRVLSPASGGALFPAEGTWEWVGDSADAVHIRVKGDGGDDLRVKQLDHCLSTLGVQGVGAGLIQLLVAGGIRTAKDIYSASEQALCKLLGPGRGKIVWKALRDPSGGWTESQLLIASAMLPRGVGERKLASLFKVETDPRKWARVWGEGGHGEVPDGWTAVSLAGLLTVLSAALAWREEMFDWVPWMQGAVASSAPPTAGTVVFTGCRDKALEARMVSRGWLVSDGVTRATTLLVVADSVEIGDSTADGGSGKLKKAIAAGIRIQNLSQIREQFP